MTDPGSPATPEPPRVAVEFVWGVTDGSAPEAASVTWQGCTPGIDDVVQAVAALAQAGDRYVFPDEPGDHQDDGPAEVLLPTDVCRRPQCGDARVVHPDNGPCTVCAESVLCPSFLDVGPVTELHRRRHPSESAP